MSQRSLVRIWFPDETAWGEHVEGPSVTWS